jgi:diguanylate cyclase (GGDEF)-like protein
MTEPDPCRLLGIDQDDLLKRLEFLRFSDEDDANIQVIERVIRADIDGITDGFYAHLGQYEELQGFLGDPSVLQQLKKSQRHYLLTLGRGLDQLGYVRDRLRIGFAHERIKLEQKWYLGAYVRLFEAIAARLARDLASTPERLPDVLLTLYRVFALDSMLVVESYYSATTRRLEQALSDLTEAQKKLQELSRIDGLTNIFNRAYLMEALEHEIARSRRFEQPFALLMIDLDHFKRVNDCYGHVFGDRVLRGVSDAMHDTIRAVDVLGRYGGEEFALGLVQTDGRRGYEVAERLRRRVEGTNFDRNGESIAVSVSVGMAVLSERREDLPTLIEQADQALYRAKEAGRNRVFAAEA